MKTSTLLPLLFVVATAATCPASAPVNLNGQWGGQHIAMTVADTGATIEYDCASGTIAGPLLADDAGAFTASGTHTRGHGGPVRVGEVPDVHPASYTGNVRGGEMTLEVKEEDTGVVVGTFVLQRDSPGQVFRCL